MTDTHRKTVDGVAYICKKMPGWTSVELLADLTSIVGEPLVLALSKALDVDGELEEEDIISMAQRAAFQLFDRIDAETSRRLMSKALLGVCAEKLGHEDDALINAFDDHFRGKPLAAIKLFVWSLEVNYRSFLDVSGFRKLLSRAKEVADDTMVLSRQTSPSSTPSDETSDSEP